VQYWHIFKNGILGPIVGAAKALFALLGRFVMKIDYGYLLAGKFVLSDNNIETTLERLLSDKFKFSVFGRFPNEEREDFFFIEQVHVLNATVDIESAPNETSKFRKWDKDDFDMGEKFEKNMSILYILTHPVLSGMRAPKIFYIIDLRVKGYVDANMVMSILQARVDREEMVPGYSGLSIPADYRKYLKPRMLDIYREIQIAKNNNMKNAAALLTGRFIDAYLTEEYEMEVFMPLQEKIASLKDDKLKKILECVHQSGNSYAKCVCGKHLKEITDEDIDKMLDFLHLFLENAIDPKRSNDLSTITNKAMEGSALVNGQ
jgi:hypothetical protein